MGLQPDPKPAVELSDTLTAHVLASVPDDATIDRAVDAAWKELEHERNTRALADTNGRAAPS